ncbi:transposable element Tcb2 transposase [Trichonephila clavipes]|nr:transposable element Tcb2 transposase [Trichonephila clavipes]
MAALAYMWLRMGQRYIDEVLLPHVRLFRGVVGDKFVCMDDNATCHRTLAVQDYLDSEGIQRLLWPARSPDLSLIENVWESLGRQVAGRNYPPTNKNTLIRALKKNGINCFNSCWIMLCKSLATLIAVSLSLGSNPGKGMDVRKSTLPSWYEGTENSCQAASPIVRLVEWMRDGRSLTTPRVFSLKITLESSQIARSPVWYSNAKANYMRKRTPLQR